MGRHKKFDRDQAVDWVMNELWRVGYEACSVKYISEKLGITRSSFYNAFESREVLFFEVLHRYFSLSPDRKLSQCTAEKRPLVLLCKVFKEICRVRANDPEHRGCLAVNSIAELVGVNEVLGPPLEAAIEQSISRFEDILNYSISQGELSPDHDTRSLALAVQNLLIGINTLSKVIQSEAQLWASTEVTLRALGIFRE
ncbi:MAG TPA: TetR/AcrR family transcriptional regulator [Aeromonadales bacterium]|nr:TetR/AcrR family transcriptional regulator [Aeromonadales bacterium]